MADVRLGLYYVNGVFAEDIAKAISGNKFTCEISQEIQNGSYIVMPYIIEDGEQKIVSRQAGSHIIDRLPLTVVNNWSETLTLRRTSAINNNLLIDTGFADLLEVSTNKTFKVLVNASDLSGISLGLFNQTDGSFVSKVSQSVSGKTFVCKVPSAVPEAKYTLIPYTESAGNRSYVERLSDKTYLVDRLPLIVIKGNDEEIYVPERIDLCYVENNTVVSEYKGVRIGEYYWMDSNFNNPTDIPVTKEQIDLAHNTYGMFDKQSTSTDGRTYWNYLGEQKGINNPNDSQIESTLLPEFRKYYGTYYTMNRDRINKLSYVRRFGSIQEKVNGELIGQDTVSHYWDGIRSIIQSKYWDLPTAADVLQLIGMCGHGTMPEVRQYLSYKENEVSVAIVAPGMDWFYPNPVNFGTSTYPSDTFDPANANKYGMNMVPNGFRWGVQKDVLTVKNESGFTTLYNVPVDELVGAGLNQALTLPVIDKDKNGMNIESRIFTSFQLGDHPVMSYNEYPSADAIPMRWCRALSDSELGYKLYINQDMTDVNYPGSPMVIYAAMIGNQYTNRKRTGEEILLEKVRKGSVNKADISIIKLGLDEQAPAGYVELPRGCIRGFYVQYILDNPTPPKTVSDLIDIALVNPFLWIAPVGQSRDSDKELRISANEISVSDIIRIYPNPVTEKLNINTNGTVDKVSIYNVSGQQVLSLKNVENSINVSHLSDGVYILRMIVDGQESVHKIMKK